MTCFKEASWLRRPRLHPAFIFPEEAARRMHLPGSLLGVRPGSPGEAEGSAAAPLAPPCPVTAAPARRPQSQRGLGAPPHTTCW